MPNASKESDLAGERGTAEAHEIGSAGVGSEEGNCSTSDTEDTTKMEDGTLEREHKDKHQLEQHSHQQERQAELQSRDSSVVGPPGVVLDEGSTTALGASSFAVAFPQRRPVTTRNRKTCSGCSCSSPRDGGRLLSIMYFVVVALLATVLPIGEGLQNAWLSSITVAAFLVYLYGTSVLFVIFVEIYLLRRSKKLRRMRRKNRNSEEADDKSADGTKSFDSGGKNNLAYTSQPSLSAPNGRGGGVNGGDEFDTRSVKSEGSTMTELFLGDSDRDLDGPLPHRISLVHRIALAVFALGLIIYIGLLIKQLHEGHSPVACSDKSVIWPHYAHLVFLLVQTFFIFKHAQVSLHYWQPLFRLGFLHLAATNWSVIVRSVVRETLDSFLKRTIDLNRNNSKPLIDTAVHSPCYAQEDVLYKAWPYLYPLILQYSLLAIAVTYSLYADTGACGTKDDSDRETDTDTTEMERRRRQSYSQQGAVNFHKTHRGLFVGLVLMAATFVAIILFFSYLDASAEDDNELSITIYYASDIGLQLIVASVVLVGWLHIDTLTFVLLQSNNGVHQTLLFIALAGSVFYRLLKFMSTYQSLLVDSSSITAILALANSIIGVGLNLLLTSFVVNSFCRRSTTRRHLKTKPGRGSVTFLLVGNLALWAFRMFHLKQVEIEGTQSEEGTYGFIAWALVLRLFVPLSIFYHYQVSACLARVWLQAYKKETVKQSLRREAEEQADSLGKGKSMDNFFPRPSPIMRMIELRRRFRKRDEVELENDAVWSPVSDV